MTRLLHFEKGVYLVILQKMLYAQIFYFFLDSCRTRGISKNVTWRTHRCSFSRSLSHLTTMWHDSFMSEVCLIHIWDVTDSFLRHDWFIRENESFSHWFTSDRENDSFSLSLSSFLPKGSRQYGWDSYSFMCVAWLIHMCGMTHSYAWHDSFICVAWLNHVCDMTHSFSLPPYRLSTCRTTAVGSAPREREKERERERHRESKRERGGRRGRVWERERESARARGGEEGVEGKTEGGRDWVKFLNV